MGKWRSKLKNISSLYALLPEQYRAALSKGEVSGSRYPVIMVRMPFGPQQQHTLQNRDFKNFFKQKFKNQNMLKCVI